MKKIIFTSDEILANVQDIFPDFDSLFDKKTKGELIVFTPPCGKPIPFTWKFPVITDDVTDYVIYEHISGRIYTYFGETTGRKAKAGDKYENKKIILEAIEKDGEIAVQMTIKNEICRESDARLIWEKYRANGAKFSRYVYDNPIPAYYKKRPIWLIGVKVSDEVKKLRDILYVSGKAIRIERNVIFDHEVVLAQPDDEKFFPK